MAREIIPVVSKRVMMMAVASNPHSRISICTKDFPRLVFVSWLWVNSLIGKRFRWGEYLRAANFDVWRFLGCRKLRLPWLGANSDPRTEGGCPQLTRSERIWTY